MELDRLNFVDTILNHLRTETIYFTLLSNRDFSKVFEHQRNDGFSGWCSDDWATVADGLTEIRQRATMIQMEMSD